MTASRIARELRKFARIVRTSPLPGDRPLRVLVGLDVGPAEPVDALLRVADDEEAPRRRALREAQDHLELERVGVLELVDQEVPDPALEVPPHVRPVTHEVSRPQEQVEEVEAARPLLGEVVGGGEARRPAGEAGDQVVAGDRPRGLDPLAQRDETGPALLQRGLVPPLRLVAELLGLVRQPRRAQERAHLVSLRQARRLVDPLRQVLERPRRAILRVLDGAARALGEAHDRRANVRVQGRRRLGVRLRIREPAEAVSRVHEREGQVAQALEPEPSLDRLSHGLGRRGVRQRLREPRLPGAVEEEAGGERVGDREPRIHAGLDGALAQEPGRERVDRPDPGDLELAERLVETGARQLAAEAHPEVGGRLLGERDGRDLGEARPPAPDEVHDATEEQRGLPAAGRRLDEERGVEVLERAAALVVVHERTGRIAGIGRAPARGAR